MLALVTMTVDHIGLLLMPQHLSLRIIGRLAFPIFAYMIAEGCRYTRSMPRYLGLMAGTAAVCQIVDFLATGSLYQCILVTFSLSLILIWIIRSAAEKKSFWGWLAAGAAVALVYFVTQILPVCLKGTDYQVDYGFWGVILPVGIYFCKSRVLKLGYAAAVLVCMSRGLGDVQLFSLLALPFLALYNGQRGKGNLKYLFYIYYPAHLAALHFLSLL